jgi:putative transposase
MTSPAPLCFDSYYHIYNRGINGENIFLEERNYAYFLRLYEKYLTPVAETFAYCLMRNHFHLSVRIKSEAEIKAKTSELKPNVASVQFSNFFNAYAKSINKAYNRTSSLFEHPFGRVLIKSDRQFWNVIAYIHQNPQKHTFVDDFREWKYSSYGIILSD